MFEAKLTEGIILKKIIESIKDLVTDVNIDITPQGKDPIIHLFDYDRMANSFFLRHLIASNGQFSCCPCIPEPFSRWL